MNDEAVTHLKEIRARLDATATLASQGLLSQVDSSDALKGVVGLVEAARRHLKAIGQ